MIINKLIVFICGSAVIGSRPSLKNLGSYERVGSSPTSRTNMVNLLSMIIEHRMKVLRLNPALGQEIKDLGGSTENVLSLTCGCSSMVECVSSTHGMWVQFPSFAFMRGVEMNKKEKFQILRKKTKVSLYLAATAFEACSGDVNKAKKWIEDLLKERQNK